MAETLIFTATFNEAGAIHEWVTGVAASVPDADILVIDDASPDGTGEILDGLSARIPQLSVIHRPGKAGLASAHLLAITSALSGGYSHLVTMDADGSHQPAQIPLLLAASSRFNFVIGTRYRGGSHRSPLLRRFLSRGANGLTRIVLPTGLSEYTTSFRVFDRPAMETVMRTEFTGGGYAFFLECVEAIYQAGLSMGEVPIDFIDRVTGESKIPKSQILLSMQTLAVLRLRRWR